MICYNYVGNVLKTITIIHMSFWLWEKSDVFFMRAVIRCVRNDPARCLKRSHATEKISPNFGKKSACFLLLHKKQFFSPFNLASIKHNFIFEIRETLL